ncbi:MAG: HEAT repeat domain-containing protein, partial [Vicinamibacteria bacterium]
LWIDAVVGAEKSIPASSRDAAFSALAEADLGSFASRLHRLAGHPDREIRFRAAAALVPTGEAWTVRLLLGNLDASSPGERNVARRALARLDPARARALLSEVIGDGTAGSFGALVYLELEDWSAIGRNLPLQAKLWEILAEESKASSPTALLAASRLSHSEAISVVTRRLTEP